ncbi:hypothetical protein [Actinokineospora iranica]|uniref:AAA domain-containing protein n=1 Tax=Actinokineospora iranica TaxID=1271860 RepID=A0A1G6WM12_9PSEU|nr:hypothetical protein [Actinokineospora iranica]SDD66809.1 hypothetical protein SAMN05216174_11575 [Actinokineospora iranica]
MPPLLWNHPERESYYLPIHDCDRDFPKFTRAMGDLDILRNRGHMVLVVGQEHSGKTAMAHRCVAWVRDHLRPSEREVVLDLTTCLPAGRELSIDDRIVTVCDRLFDQLVAVEALRPERTEALRADRNVPSRIFPVLRDNLKSGLVLIILLPSVLELTNEVVRYAETLRSGRVLFVTESSWLEDEQFNNIKTRLAAMTPPVIVRIGKLGVGDVAKYITDRLHRHGDLGVYPKVEPAVTDLMETFSSIGMVQQHLHGTYEMLLDEGLNYDQTGLVTVDDVRRYLNEIAVVGSRTRP